MRAPRVATLAIVAALVMAACATDEAAPDGQAAPEPADDDPVAEDDAPEEPDQEETGGQLVAAISQDPGQLNPAITTAGAVHGATPLLYNGLVDLDENLEPVPELAESWDIEDDGATYRFHLRDDVVWHDGTPFTADDVVYSFEEVLLLHHARTSASVGSAITSIEATDDHTVEFRFEAPYAPLLQQLDVGEAPIIPKHVFEGSDPLENPANLDPIGTGPFRFVSYTPDSELVYEANPDYWKEGLPLLDRVVLRIIPEASSQIAALETGEIDFVFRVTGPDVERLDADPDITLLSTFRGAGAVNCPMTMSFNLEREILQDPQVRWAIAHAIDREQFVERVLFGAGRVPAAPIHSAMVWAHADDVELPGFDRSLAEQLLDDAGWVVGSGGTRVADGLDGVDDGTPFEIDFLHFEVFNAYGELLRAQLREVGIEVTQRPINNPEFAERVFADREFDTNIISFCQGPDPEIGLRRQLDSNQIGPTPFTNAAAYANERVDELFAEASRLPDLDERAVLYRELQEIVTEDLPYFWITEPEFVLAHSARCNGFQPFNHFAETATCSG